MGYKKVNTQRIEHDVYQRNRNLTNDSKLFFVVAPENSLCFHRYLAALKEDFDTGDNLLMMKNSFHQSGSYATDFQNNYRLYEITRSKQEDGRTHLRHELMY